MFGLFINKNKKEAAEETAKIIKDEFEELRRGLASDAEGISSQAVSSLRDSLSLMGGAVDKRLSELEEQLQQSLRHERRRQMALESIVENQNKTLETLERKEIQEEHLEAMMSLAENAALTRLANPESIEIDILYNKLTDLMNCFGLTLTADSGAVFDPERHEACGARCELDRQDNSVLEIVRPGFLLRGKLLRCATVIVNRHDRGYEDPPADGPEDAQ